MVRSAGAKVLAETYRAKRAEDRGQGMRDLLREHRKMYPCMQVQDAVKLLYQSEFGGGHMIANPQKSLEFLKQEQRERKGHLASLKKTDFPVCQPIGGGMYRISLDALDEGLSPETLNQMFVQTADHKMGTREGLEEKFRLLLQCSRQGDLPFGEEQVLSYLDDYRAKGYPMVSHSAVYREAYSPAYRVVSEAYVRYYRAFCRIDQALKKARMSGGRSQVLAAIDGMCASGKSTMGRILQGIYSCNLFHMDDYFLQPHQRTEERMKEIGGNVDYERFQKEILAHIGDEKGLSYQVYDCSKRQLAQRIQVPRSDLNIVEGSYSQHPYFGPVWDLRFFCGISEEEQISRIRLRNGEAMLERFKNEWIPKENEYFTAFSIREKSIAASE